MTWQNIEARTQSSVPTCPQPKFHFAVQDIADIQHAAAQPAHITETDNNAMNQLFKLGTLLCLI